MRKKVRKEVMKVFNQEADVDIVVENILLLFGFSDFKCPDCGSETLYDTALGLYKCDECEWTGHKK